MMRGKSPLRHLSIFLLKEGVVTAEDALKSGASADECETLAGRKAVGRLFVARSRSRPPKWARLFDGYFDTTRFGKVSSTAGVLFIKQENRLFALTFGHGRYLLKPECYEERFGLIVALNSVKPDSVRSVDKRSFNALLTHSRIESSKKATALEFGIDIDQDLLRALTGMPADVEVGERMSGIDSLSVQVRTDLGEVNGLLTGYLKAFSSTAYRKSFAWVDRISEVRSLSKIEELNETLVEKITARHLDRCWLSVPVPVPWDRVAGFKYSRSQKSPEHTDIHFETFLSAIPQGKSLTLDVLQNRCVYCMDDQGAVIDEWSVFRCTYCEIEVGEDVYLLNGAKWYRIARNFVEEVNWYFEKMPQYGSVLPEYTDTSETAYNSRIAAADPAKYTLMDEKLIEIGGGRSSVEFADLYTRSRDLIHIKRYGGSSVLSHLFAQALVSGELLKTEAEFRALVNEKLPPDFQLGDGRVDASQFTVVFAVISDVPGPLRLPFFLRLNLRHTAKRLTAIGFNVAKAKIEVEQELRVRKRFAPARSAVRRSVAT